MSKKILDFTGTKISDVKQINPLFSTCKVRVLYTGRNRNMSIISRDAVDRALPSIIGVPIVGEFAMDNKDFKGHGGAIDLDSYDFVHTTKPYGFVPESATFSWEEVKTRDGSIREYLVVDGCRLWTGRYPEAFSIVETGKGQSMEIEVNDGVWDDKEEAYDIKNFTFSALCILGDEVDPAFEDANITATFAMDSDAFKLEYAKMMKDVKSTLLQEKEEDKMDLLKQLIEKYSTTMEVLTAKGLNFEDISEDELEAKIVEALKPEKLVPVTDKVEDDKVELSQEELDALKPEILSPKKEDGLDISDVEDVEPKQNPEAPKDVADVDPQVDAPDGVKPEEAQTEQVADAQKDAEALASFNEEVEALEKRVEELEAEREAELNELKELREFKLNVEKTNHTAKAEKLFADFQLTTEDIDGLDVHNFTINEIEEKCYAILGRKMASKKNFSKAKDTNIRLPLGDESNKEHSDAPYNGLFDKYNK